MIKGKQNSYERIADWSEWEVNGEDRNEQLKWNNENVTEEWEMLYWLSSNVTSPHYGNVKLRLKEEAVKSAHS